MHSQSSRFAFRSRAQGIMFYLDGLFVSQSNGVLLDPLLCFAIGAGVLLGLGAKECNCKMCVSGGTAGEGSESV